MTSEYVSTSKKATSTMANRLAMNVEGMGSHPEDSSKEDNTDVTTERNIGVSGGNNVVLKREYGE